MVETMSAVGARRYSDWYLSGLHPDMGYTPDVRRIYRRYEALLDEACESTGEDGHSILNYFCGHIVWNDGNMSDESIMSSIDWAKMDLPKPVPGGRLVKWLAIRALRELLRVPKERRLFWVRTVETCVMDVYGCQTWDVRYEFVPYSEQKPATPSCARQKQR